MIRSTAALGALLLLCNLNSAAIVVGSDSAIWTPVSYSNNVETDYSGDTQANSVDLDIVGNASHPGFYTLFDNGGTTSVLTDGEVGFRLRMAGDQGQPTFGGQAWIGMDVDADGALDLFIGADKDFLSIHDAGTGANNSPSTTTIEAAPVWSQAVSQVNFLWTAVSPELDSNATSFDIDGATKPEPDFFLSFVVPFSELVDAVTTLTGVTTFDDTSPLAYIAATASQANSLNSDLNGVDGQVNSTITWTDLDGITPTVSVTGEPYSNVPEPATTALAAGILALLILMLRRPRKNRIVRA